MEGLDINSSYRTHVDMNQGPDLSVLSDIKRGKSTEKEQLKKVAGEFEAIFVTKMISAMDKTVDREGGVFGEESKFMDNFKSLMFNDIGRQIANSPTSNIGLAKQLYAQMEKTVKE